MNKAPRISALGQLYDSVTRANGWSLRDVERRIEQREMHLSKSRISQLVSAKRLPSISVDTIESLAAGLGVSKHRVARAAVESMGYHVAGDDVTTAEAVARDETLSEESRQIILSILKASERRRSG